MGTVQAYFNPFDGRFQVNENFSQIIWFYFDLGVIGVLIFFLTIFSYFRLFNITRDIKLILLILMICYSFYSNTLDSIVFLMTLNIYTFLIHKTKKA